jgi:hypothetical protein
VEISQLDSSSECDSGCIVSYCQFLNASRCVHNIPITPVRGVKGKEKRTLLLFIVSVMN